MQTFVLRFQCVVVDGKVNLARQCNVGHVASVRLPIRNKPCEAIDKKNEQVSSARIVGHNIFPAREDRIRHHYFSTIDRCQNMILPLFVYYAEN